MGPKDLRYGIDSFLTSIKNLSTPIVAANVHGKKSIYKSRIININQLKIGIIGFTIEKLDEKYPENANLSDSINAVKEISEELRTKQVKTIIALGYSEDNGFMFVMARACPEIDLIVFGTEGVNALFIISL